MRRKVVEQLGLVTTAPDHVGARELAMMSRVLDGLPQALEVVVSVHGPTQRGEASVSRTGFEEAGEE